MSKEVKLQVLESKVQEFNKELHTMFGRRIDFYSPDSAIIRDYLQHAEYKIIDNLIDIHLNCKNAGDVIYKNIDDVNWDVLGHITRAWITSKDSESKRITLYLNDSDQVI